MAETEACPICGGNLTKTKINEKVEIDGQSVVIEDVPVKICYTCGETIVDYGEMQRITEAFKDRKQIEGAREDYKAGRFKKVKDLLIEEEL